MARLSYVAPPGAVTDRIRARRGGTLTPLDGMLLHSPEFADGWNSMLGAVRGQSTLPPDVRELVILRVAARNGADFEWIAHEPVAREAGLGDEQIAAIGLGGAGSGTGAGGGAGPGGAGPGGAGPGGAGPGGAGPGGAGPGGAGAGAGLSPAQWAALAYADAMTTHVAVPGEIFQAVRAHFDDRQVLELTVTVAAYNMVSRVLVALEVRPGDDPFPAG
jgi:4-carboxymuconolactone decarboxylase